MRKTIAGIQEPHLSPGVILRIQTRDGNIALYQYVVRLFYIKLRHYRFLRINESSIVLWYS